MKIVVALFTAALLASTIGTPGVSASRPNGKVATEQAAYGASAIQVPAVGPCPAWRDTYRDVSNSGAVLRTTLLPKGALFGRICRYGLWKGSSRITRLRAALINGRTTNDFEANISALRTGAPSGSSNCPAQFFGATILAFGYSGGRVIDLWYNDSGCQALDNGYVKAFESKNPKSFAQLIRLADLIAPVPASAT